MNIPFPVIYPQLMVPDWFNTDRPCDEDAELTLMEQENKQWLSTLSKNFMKRIPVIKLPPAKVTTTEPPEDNGSDDDVSTNDESTSLDESNMDEEESPGPDEEEGITISISNTEDGSDTTESTAEVIVVHLTATSRTMSPEDQIEME